ncbi:hypothetical protein DIE15_32540 [Burkholderia sp. Bp9031]|nr:hypothetical protein DIE15_32540 [Burkholderia sp. Bp9031]
MAARHHANVGLNTRRVRAFAATPDVLKYPKRSDPIAVHVEAIRRAVHTHGAARDAARTTFGRGRLAAPFTCNWSQS